MALTLVSGPTTSQPIPISDCLAWELLPDSGDIVVADGEIATIVFTFQASPTDPGDTTSFVLWGFTFTTNSATDYTANSFKVETGDQLQTMNNFASMLLSNFFFVQNVSINVDSGAGEVTVSWNECGAQENFGASQMVFDELDGPVLDGSPVVTNGTTPEYLDGYTVNVQLFRVDTDNSDNTGPIMAFEGMTPNRTCAGPESVVFDGMPTVRRLLKTPLPDLDNTHPDVNYDEIIQYFTLLYGWTYRDADRQKHSGDFVYSSRSFVWNAFFTAKDVYKTRRYWPDASGGLPADQTYVRFLTTQPAKMKVLIDSKCWLWYMVNEGVQSWVNLRLYFNVTKKDGSGSFKSVVVTNSGYGINAVNVSPSYLLTLGVSGLTADNLDHYTVKIVTQNSGSPLDITTIVEEKAYYIIDGCDNEKDTDIYFLTPIGGIGTIPVRIIEKTANQQGDEILLDVPCSATDSQKAKYGGRTLSNIRSYDSFRYRSLDNGNITDFFRDLKLSPQRWVRTKREDGTWIARKLIVEPGGVKVYEDGQNTTVEVTGYLGDLIIQSGTEPNI